MGKLINIKLRKHLNRTDAICLIKWLEDNQIITYMNEDKSMVSFLCELLKNRQEALLTYYLNQRNDFYMIDYEDHPVGFVALKPVGENVSEVVIAIGCKEMWGQKIAHYTLLEIIKEAKNKCHHLAARVHQQNKRSINLFEHIGFQQEQLVEPYLHYSYK